MVRFILTFLVNSLILIPFCTIVQYIYPLESPVLRRLFLALDIPYELWHISVVLSTALLLLSCLLTRSRLMQFWICWITGCKSAQGGEGDKLAYVMEAVCRFGGQDRRDYKLYVSDRPDFNAFAVGDNHIAVTRPLLQAMPEAPLAGIVAHEMGHLLHGDSRLGYMCFVMSWFGNLVIRIYQWIVMVLNVLCLIPFVGWALIPVTWLFLLQIYIFHFLLNLPLWFTSQFLSRRDEYAADRYACEIGLGPELYEGLSLLTVGEQKQSFWKSLISDHPLSKKRLQRIRQYIEENR